MSVPRILKTDINTIPSDLPYIEPDLKLVHHWKERLAHDKNFKIGICWQGNAKYSTLSLRKAVASKSIPLEQFAPLFSIPNVSVYSLQRINGTDQVYQLFHLQIN